MPGPGLARALEQALGPGLAPAQEQGPGLARALGPGQARGLDSDSAPSAKYFHTPPQAAGLQGRRIEVNRFGTG